MAVNMIAEIVGPTGRVHYRRPIGDKLIAEAEGTPGYSVRIVREDSYDVGHGFRFHGSKGDEVHSKLKRAISKPTRRYLWVPEDEIEFIPALSPRIYGDGRALLKLSTINQRPKFYVLRIDSSWALALDYRAPDGAVDVVEFIDHFVDGLEEDFGPARDEDGKLYSDDEWPAYDDNGGCSWSRMSWPNLRSLRFEPHPFVPHTNILSANTAAI
jgi:hypothetical protein